MLRLCFDLSLSESERSLLGVGDESVIRRLVEECPARSLSPSIQRLAPLPDIDPLPSAPSLRRHLMAVLERLAFFARFPPTWARRVRGLFPASCNASIFKFPLGFIRIVELFFILISLLAANSWYVHVRTDCPTDADNRTLHLDFFVYSFSLNNLEVPDCFGRVSRLWREDHWTWAAGVFHAIVLVSFILVSATLLIYVFAWTRYEKEKRLIMADLFFTSFLLVAWFLSGFIWWAAASMLGYATRAPNFWGRVARNYPLDVKANTSAMAVSVVSESLFMEWQVACWACVVLFGGNCWFVFKELWCHKSEEVEEEEVTPPIPPSSTATTLSTMAALSRSTTPRASRIFPSTSTAAYSNNGIDA